MKHLALLLLFLVISCQSPEKVSGVLRTYTLEELSLVPEGIDYSKVNDAYYLSSVTSSKIVEVNKETGEQRNFIEPNEYGYSPGVGLLVDDERGLLHAIGGYYLLPDSLSSLYTFSLSTGQLIQRYDMIDGGEHFLNDMILDDGGNLYLTNTKDSSVYILPYGQDTLELFFKSTEILFPNGIAINEDNTKLYVASIPKGVRILDLESKTILNQQDTTGASQGIDGLEYYNGHLYGVQNSVAANSFNFRKLILNEREDEIVDVSVIDSHTSLLDVPLTFCLDGDEAVVIGNSNLQYLNQVTLEFADSDRLQNTKLLVYSLK